MEPPKPTKIEVEFGYDIVLLSNSQLLQRLVNFAGIKDCVVRSRGSLLEILRSQAFALDALVNKTREK